MSKVKETAAKSGKKTLRHDVETIITTALSGVLNGAEISKSLHKKIKKAGKLLADGISEIKRPVAKTTKRQKTVPKKVVAKKVAKKAASK